jgi:predicted HD superfamily hydrolase involved in NAD metabolism
MLTDFKTWRYPERILSACTLAVFDREDFFTDYQTEKEYFNKTFGTEYVKLSYVGKSCSSTKTRVYASFGLSLDGQVPDGVEEYIRENGLYSGDKYTEFIKNNLPEKRLIHTANVVVKALSKAKELGLDKEKVRISATLHDVAKYLDYTKVKGFTLPEGVPGPVVHSFLGAYVAKNVLGVDDEEILDAIRYHTSGKAEMSTLGKLIFVADMIEEGRDYQGVEKLRESFEKDDFDKCFIECLKEEFLHLINKKQYIYEETLNAFKYYVE